MEIKLESSEVLNKLKTIENLPTIPIVASKLMTLLTASNTSLKEISKIMTSDPAITANVLKIANSAYYTTSKEVDSVRMALVIIGESQITNIVYSLSIYRVFSDEIDTDFQEKFYEHALATAHVAQLLTNNLKIRARDYVFTAGLIHNIGLIILNQYYNNQFRLVELLVDKKNMKSHEAFTKILSINQYEIGAWLTKRWQLPHYITSSIVKYDCSNFENSKEDELAAIVHLASIITSIMGFSILDKYDPEDFVNSKCWSAFSNNSKEINKEEILESILNKKENILEFIDLIKKA